MMPKTRSLCTGVLTAFALFAAVYSTGNAVAENGASEQAPTTPLAEVLFEVRPPGGARRYVSDGAHVLTGEQLRVHVFMREAGYFSVYHRGPAGRATELYSTSKALAKGARQAVPPMDREALTFEGGESLETLLVAVWRPDGYQAFRRALTATLEGPVRARRGFQDMTGQAKHNLRGDDKMGRSVPILPSADGVGLVQIGLQQRGRR